MQVPPSLKMCYGERGGGVHFTPLHLVPPDFFSFMFFFAQTSCTSPAGCRAHVMKATIRYARTRKTMNILFNDLLYVLRMCGSAEPTRDKNILCRRVPQEGIQPPPPM